jgi:uncharacterized repeat protein (TIGR01451 family)
MIADTWAWCSRRLAARVHPPQPTGAPTFTAPDQPGRATEATGMTATPTPATTSPPTSTAAPSLTATRAPTPPRPSAAPPAPTADVITEPQGQVLGIAIERVRARRGQQPTAPVQVPQPPVQLPPIGNGIVNFFMAAFAGSQPVANGDPICGLALTMGSTVEPSVATVGDSVDFTYTVTNLGTVALADVQVASALPAGLNFVSASSGGAIEPQTGFVAWALQAGLAAGASTTVSTISARSPMQANGRTTPARRAWTRRATTSVTARRRR